MKKDFDKSNENKKARHAADRFVWTEGVKANGLALTGNLASPFRRALKIPPGFSEQENSNPKSIRQTEKPPCGSFLWTDDFWSMWTYQPESIIPTPITMSTHAIPNRIRTTLILALAQLGLGTRVRNNQKASAEHRDTLMRRPAESNRIPVEGTSWLSVSGQNHLTSTSSCLRMLCSKVFGNKNNTSISEDVVSGPISGDAPPTDNQDEYSTRENTVKASVDNRKQTSLALATLGLGIFSFATFFLHVPPAHAAGIVKSTASPGLNSGLVGYWDFNEGQGSTAHDYSGQGNTGTLTNMSESIPWVQGNTGLGNALKFDGVNDYVNVTEGSSTPINSSTITFSVWIKTSSLPFAEDVGIVAKWAATGYILWAYQGNIRWGDNASSLVVWTGGSAIVADGQWHLLTATRDATTMYLYFDSVLKASAGKGTFTYDTTPLTFGTYSNGAGKYLNGSLDDVRIYNRALSQAEITRLYNLKKTLLQGADQTGMVGWWKMDEGSGTVAGDSSGNRNNGTLTGMASPPTATSGWGGGKKNHGTGLLFDGVDDYVNVPSVNAIAALNANANSYSFSFWIKSSGPGASTRIIDKGDGSIYSISGQATNTTLSIYIYDGTHVPGIGYGNIWNNMWRHVVFVVNKQPGQLVGYLDGIQIGTTLNTVTATTANSVALVFGKESYTSTLYSKMALDDVRIYNRALSQTEITKIYKEKAGVKIGVAPNNPTLNTGLVGYWTFDGKNTGATYATDSSGNGNTGTLTNGPVPTIGKIGQALKFDGVNDFVSVPDSSIFEPPALSFSFWVYPNSLASNPIFLQNGIAYFISGTSGLNRISVTVRTDTGTLSDFQTNNNALTLNQWQLVTMTWDNVNVIIYVNGVSKGIAARGGTKIDPQNASLFIGSNNGANTLNGSIDDVRIYNRALTASEVKRLYNGGR